VRLPVAVNSASMAATASVRLILPDWITHTRLAEPKLQASVRFANP